MLHTIFILIMTSITGGGPLMAEEAVSNQTVQREVDRLAKEVNFLRKQTEGLTGKPAPDAVHVSFGPTKMDQLVGRRK